MMLSPYPSLHRLIIQLNNMHVLFIHFLSMRSFFPKWIGLSWFGVSLRVVNRFLFQKFKSETNLVQIWKQKSWWLSGISIHLELKTAPDVTATWCSSQFHVPCHKHRQNHMRCSWKTIFYFFSYTHSTYSNQNGLSLYSLMKITKQ